MSLCFGYQQSSSKPFSIPSINYFFLKIQQGVCQTMALPFIYIKKKSILRQKKKYGNSTEFIQFLRVKQHKLKTLLI
jgi:hypothetical protein